MKVHFKNMSDGTVLTDVCRKSNKSISYSGHDDALRPIIIETHLSSWCSWQQFYSLVRTIFLPKGYPETVSTDYLEYQVWDTCQAFCSCISGTLAMRAVMEGIGVGSEAATPASAAVTWIMKDGTGMIGSILFAWLKGSKLDSDCKKWRLFADILNDIAIFVELYTPFHLEHSMYLLCVATAFKAIVGTAGSSTRAALITHQAIKGNIADVSAKDGSQEIFINLCAYILGVFLLKYVTETREIWTVMCTATFFHLLFNYNAVKCLRMNTFNSERFCLTLRAYLPTSSLPSVEQVNRRESVFLLMGLTDMKVFGFSVKFGVSLKKAVENLSFSQFSTLVTLFQSKKYIIMPQLKKKKLLVSFRKDCPEREILKAYFHAALLGISLTFLLDKKTLKVMSRVRRNSPIFRLKNILKHSAESGESTEQEQFEAKLLLAFTTCKNFVEKEFLAFSLACKEQEWNLDRHLINVDEWSAEWIYVEEKKIERSTKQNVAPRYFDLKPVKSRETLTKTKMNVLVIS